MSDKICFKYMNFFSNYAKIYEYFNYVRKQKTKQGRNYHSSSCCIVIEEEVIKVFTGDNAEIS